MVELAAVLSLIDARKNRALRLAQSSLPQRQFLAFRGLFLDEFGKNGLESELAQLFAERKSSERIGSGRNR